MRLYSPLLLPAIEQWRSTLTLTERLKLNHPATVMKRKRTCSPQGGRQSLTRSSGTHGVLHPRTSRPYSPNQSTVPRPPAVHWWQGESDCGVPAGRI